MSASISTGEDLREFETEHLGFRALSQGSEGPKKLKILPEPWPSENLPPSCATLLSVASNPGLLAAAGPNALVVTSTEKVRKAFHEKAGEGDVITDFTPDVTIQLGSSPLRHVVFSSAGDFLIISAEDKGGLAVFSTADLLAGKKEPQAQIPTDDVAVRALLPNPSADVEHYMAAVLESGKLCLIDVANNNQTTLQDRSVSCVTWSTKGKAVAAGLQDGSVVIQMTDGTIKGTIPRPEGVEESYEVTGVVWIKNTELLVAHGPRASPTADEEENKYHIVKCNKTWTEFEFHSTPWDPLPAALQPPPRAAPSRFSAIRLSGWEPDLDDMLIITTSQTDTITILTSSSKPLAAGQTQAECAQWVIANPEDSKKASVPRMVYGEDGDSLLIGEALDLSATEKVLRPIPALEEISEAPWPLPAYMALTHQGVLMVWWVVWNRSIEKGTRFPGLVAGSDDTQQKAAFTQKDTPASPAPNSFAQSSTPINRPASQASPFGKPAATFGSPSIPSFGAPGLGSTPPFIPKPAQAAFGSSGFGSTTPATAKPTQPTFGSAGFGSAAKPAAPAFGSPSAMGGAQTTSGFGAVGAMGSKSSPWAANSSTQANPFSSAAGTSSGFAKFGQTGGTSSFSSFGSNNGSQSGFGTFGQTQQKSSFPGLKTEPSTGSTITINSGTGSTLPSWANTPAQQGSGLFGGQSKFSSFNTSSFESKTSETSDAENRKRDEATPTPQPQPQAAKGLFGLAGGFKLGTTFTSDGTAKDDPAKPAAPSTGSFFGSDFTSGLGGNNLKAPATPAKDTGKDDSQDMSTTPTSPPKQQELKKPDQGPARESATPRAPPPAEEKPAPVDDAPLPPDFLTTKPTKSVDDDLPPLAGSPGVKVEAPSSSVEASPIDEEDGFSVEEEEEEDDDEQPVEPSPSDTQRKPQPVKPSGFSFQDSVNQSPAGFPPAPTPPVARPNNATQPSLFGNSSRPIPTQPLFGQAQQPQQTGLFASTQSKAPAQPYFAPPVNRPQDSLRSPSPVRSASTSALRTRRDPITTSGTPLSASIQIAKPPTPQPPVTLEDEEDERMRAQLASAIEPSRTLEEFVAYQNYSGNKSPTKTGTAAQIELIYKDINGMIDMLGWNARSIKSFTEYHKQPQSGHKVDRETLEDINDEGEDGSWFESWTIGEIEGLKAIVDDLDEELEAGRVQDVIDKLQQLNRLLRDKAKCMTRVNDIRRQIINRQDPERVAASRKAPLSKEAADLQKTLRIEYARLLTSLGQAEEASVVLRSRLASHNAQQGKTGAVPTMDAVKKTIIKMTSLAEKRNNDITLIESQMRKLGLVEPSRPSSSSSRTMGTPRRSRGTSLRNSTADSPFATPPAQRLQMSLSELNRRALTPDVDPTPIGNKGYGLSYAAEGSPGAGKDLAHLSDLVDENMDTLRETAKRRKQVAGSLKKALIERGVKTTRVN